MSFPHEAILVFNFFSALVDAFPYHSWPSATRDMGKCINACWEKVEHSNCLMWKSYILHLKRANIPFLLSICVIWIFSGLLLLLWQNQFSHIKFQDAVESEEEAILYLADDLLAWLEFHQDVAKHRKKKKKKMRRKQHQCRIRRVWT